MPMMKACVARMQRSGIRGSTRSQCPGARSGRYRTRAAAMLGALLLAAPFAAHAAKIYKWTDAQGNVIYTDTPLPGAVELHTPTEPAGVVPVPPGERTEPKERAAWPAAAYDAVTVMAPADGEVLQNTEGWVDVSLAIAPALRVADGH